MTKEMLEKRLQEIEKGMAQMTANLNLMEGGRQECLHWLKQLNSSGLSLDNLKNVIGADSVEIEEVKHD